MKFGLKLQNNIPNRNQFVVWYFRRFLFKLKLYQTDFIEVHYLLHSYDVKNLLI